MVEPTGKMVSQNHRQATHHFSNVAFLLPFLLSFFLQSFPQPWSMLGISLRPFLDFAMKLDVSCNVKLLSCLVITMWATLWDLLGTGNGISWLKSLYKKSPERGYLIFLTQTLPPSVEFCYTIYRSGGPARRGGRGGPGCPGRRGSGEPAGDEEGRLCWQCTLGHQAQKFKFYN